MIIIFGQHTKQHPVGLFPGACGGCGPGTALARIVIRKAAHIFWIPLFPTGTLYYLKCQRCGMELREPFDRFDAGSAGLMALCLTVLFLGVALNSIYNPIGSSFCGGVLVVVLICALMTGAWMFTLPARAGSLPPPLYTAPQGQVPVSVPAGEAWAPPAQPVHRQAPAGPLPCPTCGNPGPLRPRQGKQLLRHLRPMVLTTGGVPYSAPGTNSPCLATTSELSTAPAYASSGSRLSSRKRWPHV